MKFYWLWFYPRVVFDQQNRCEFNNGTIYGKDLKFYVGTPDTEYECENLAKEKYPDALAATYFKSVGCYAEYGTQVKDHEYARYCHFKGKIKLI